MSGDLELGLKINIDRKEGESNLAAFTRAFNQALRDLGKSGDEVAAFHRLALDVEAGRQSLESLDEATRKLLSTYRTGSAQAADMDFLGLRQHQQIQQEIAETREAYERLKASGTLTGAELAQAAVKTEERIRSLRAQTNGWAESIANAKGAFAGLAASGAGLVAVAGQAVQFESAMADVAKVVGGTEEQLAQLASRIKGLSAELPISSDALAQMAAAGGQLGVPIEKLETFIDLAAKMATAFGMSADEAGQAVAKLSNVFGMQIEQVERLGDAINTLGNTTAAREADIVNVLTRVGGSARQFGLTAEQAAALASSMLSLGMTSEVAGTGINALLSKLQTANVQGKDFQAALSQMGLSARQLAEDIRNNPQAALTEFLRSLDRLDKQSRAEILTRLFGAEYQDDIARLLNGLEGYEQSLSRVSDAAATAGAMQKEFETRVKTTEAQLQLLKNGVEAIAINLGSVFLPALRSVAGALGDVTHGVARFVEDYPAIAGAATALASVAASAGALRVALLALRVVGVQSFGGIAAAVAGLNKTLPELAAQAGRAATALSAAGRLGASAWVGWNIGSALKEQFVEVERAGIALAAGLTKAAARAQGAWEMLQAIGTDDTIAAAYDRMQQKLQQIDDEYAELFARAGQTSAAQVEGANAAAEANELVIESLVEIPAHAERAAGEVKEIATALEAGSEGADKARESLEKLSAVDLSALAEKARVALEASKISAEEFARVNDEVLIESFRRLGIDGVVALGGISDASQEAIDAVDRIAASLKAAKEGAETAGPAIEAALTKAFAVADNLPALERMVEQMEALGRSGQLGAAAMTRLADEAEKARARIEDMTPGIQSVEEAMRRLGVTSQRELDRAGGAAKEAFEKIRESGAATERELREAFTAYAKAAVEANEGVVEATVAAQAAALGLKVSVDAAGKVIVQSFKEAREAARKLAEEEEAAAEAAKNLGDEAVTAAERVEESVDRVGATALGLAEDLEQGLTVPWLTGAAAASRYASEAIEAAKRAATAWSNIVNPYEAMETYARRYIAALEDLDRRQADLGSSAARSLDDAKLRLLELTGSEEEIAKAREARDRAEIERQVALIQLEMQRARLRSDSAEAERLEAELRLLREHLDVLGQIHRAEARQREGKSTKSGGGGGVSGGGGAEVPAPSVRPQVNIVVNNTIEGLLDTSNRGSMEAIGRSLAPIWADLQRRGAF